MQASYIQVSEEMPLGKERQGSKEIAVSKDFPILQTKIRGKPLIYLDSAATSQKPLSVITAIDTYYKTTNANIHRGLHTLSGQATDLYEGARKKIATFIGANEKEIIFVRNATEAINLVAHTLHPKRGDMIVSTVMEHHSNIVPWQQVAQQTGALLAFIPLTKEGLLDMKKTNVLFAKKPLLVAFTHVSNVLGTINPVKELVALAHKYGALVLVDGAQAVPHIHVNVKELDADFYVFSGHKMLGPTGIGVLYGKKALLEKMDPFLTGGDMIKEVALEGSTWNELPWKFEAGTPNIAGAIGLGTAVDYLQSLGMENIQKHEQELLQYALEKMKCVAGVTMYGPLYDPLIRSGVIAFNLGDIHPHDLASVLDDEGIAIRSGHHCAQPLMQTLGVSATARISVSVYTTKKDIDVFLVALEKARRIFRL